MSLRLLFLVTEDWYFVSHRLSLAIAAREAGYEVIVATRVRNHADTIRGAGIKLVPFQLSRRGGNPLLEIAHLVSLYRREKPTIVHHVALKAVIYGSLAAKLAGVEKVVNAVAGLGWLFTSESIAAKVLRCIVVPILGFLLSSAETKTIVQNKDDWSLLESMGIPARQLVLIRGAGVDTTLYSPAHSPPLPVIVVLVARMLWDKGVGEFIAAASHLQREGLAARFVLVGDADPENPASVPVSALKNWHSQKRVEWWGRREDIALVLRQAHVACLPSYREGLPMSLLEAAACGLPIVTTNTPGCREVVVHGENGFLVPPKDDQALADALRKLILNASLRRSMGEKSRFIALNHFSQRLIITETLAVYHAMIRPPEGTHS